MATIRKKVYVVNPDGTKTDLNNIQIKSFKGARAGCVIYNGFEIPYTAKVYQDKNGESFYVSGIRQDAGKYYVTVKYFERETENKFVEHPYNSIASYLE